MSRLGQQDAADRELALVSAGLAVPSLRATNDPFSDAYQGGLVARYILEGVIAEGRGRNEAARTAFEAAVRTEDALVYDEPRDWALPARHYLGDLLLTMGRPAEAAAVFNRDLQINPLNGWSLTGLREAYERTKDRAGVKRVDTQLQTAWQMRDREVKRAVY